MNWSPREVVFTGHPGEYHTVTDHHELI